MPPREGERDDNPRKIQRTISRALGVCYCIPRCRGGGRCILFYVDIGTRPFFFSSFIKESWGDRLFVILISTLACVCVCSPIYDLVRNHLNLKSRRGGSGPYVNADYVRG